MNSEIPQQDGPTSRVDVGRRLAWYVCHNCGWEAWIADSVRTVLGCGNAKCYDPCLHVHSNADGEMPKTLSLHG